MAHMPPPMVHPGAQQIPKGMRLPPPELTAIEGWDILSQNFTRMMGSQREEEVSKELGILRLPDQCYEDCWLRLNYQKKPVLDFNVVDALRAARITKEEAEKCDLKCMYNAQWKDKNVEMHHTGVHWTYDVQDYDGKVLEAEGVEGGEIDMDLLRDTTQPIRHYLSTILLEDDLEDCGTSKLTLKFRCMQTCWFVLMRHFIRVDRVRVVIKDVRWFHRFGTDHVVMHKVLKTKDISDQADPQAVERFTEEAPPLRLYNNPDELAQTLPVAEEKTYTFKLP